MNTKTAYVFDVDGTVTDLLTKRVRFPEIFDIFSTIIARGDVLAFVTGRATTWMKRELLDPFLLHTNKRLLPDDWKHIIFIGEKGTCWMTCASDGSVQRNHDNSYALPKPAVEDIKNIAVRHKNTMFFDTEKEVIRSVEMNHNLDMATYKTKQKLAQMEIADVILIHGLDETFRVTLSRIAVDIDHKDADKKMGIARCLSLLSDTNIHIGKTVVVGDQKMDLEMGEWLWDKGIPMTFVYVGDQTDVKLSEYPFPVITPKEKYDEGFVEYFSKNIN